MKPIGSSLNPYATSYIPLSKREANKTFIPENSSRGNIGTIIPGYSEHHIYNPQYDDISPFLNMHRGEKAPGSVASAVKNHPFHGPSSRRTEMAMMFGREMFMELELLHESFPGLSDQSITEVYFANKGDLDAAIDMLNQLENKHSADFEYAPQSLPDSLDIGDISESGFADVSQPSFRMKSANGGPGTSSRF